ncbi:MAG: hypothetical protein HYY05_03540 [Chloroflexi bacterium]|nr:hypothetical protein [Chloroflexota bacterium]
MTTRERASTRRDPIPAFESIEEEAAFWDTHDLADYWDDFKPVEVRFARNLSAGLHIRLDPASAGELRGVAREKGVGPSTLARMWILEHLKQEREAQRR